MNKEYTIGVDIGGTKINTGLIDRHGQIVAMSSIPTAAEAGYRTIANNIIDQVYAILDQAGLALAQIESLGFGIPGTVNSKEGVVLFAPNLQWQNIAFAKLMRAEFATPICIGQDTHAAVWAEFLFGAGVGCNNVVCLTLGTGIGSGLVINQQLYLGSLTYVGEVGHSLVELNGRPCSCGNNGCLETYASGSAIQKRGREMIDNYQELVQDAQKGLTTPDIISAAEQGHPQAQQVVAEAVAYLGMGIVNLIHLFGPEKVIISGGLSNAETLILEPVKAFVQQRSYANVAELVEITKAKLGEYAPMIGAAFLYQDDRYRYGG
jgi:glucokinase